MKKIVLYIDLEGLQQLAVGEFASYIIANLSNPGLLHLSPLREQLPQYANSASELLTILKGL